MKLFISWSGDRSKLVASMLVELLPDVIQGIKPWMSAHQIGAGARWAQELSKELEACNFGIICLTSDNLESPWLLYEAGSLAKSVSEARVVPYRLGVSASDVPYPLAQFQGVDSDEAGTRKLIDEINSRLPAPLESTRLDRIFDRWWPDVRKRLECVPIRKEDASRRTERDLLEELIGIVRQNVRPQRRIWSVEELLAMGRNYREMSLSELQDLLDFTRPFTMTMQQLETLHAMEEALFDEYRERVSTMEDIDHVLEGIDFSDSE